MGDAATEYVRTVDLNTVRNSSLPETLASDDFHNVSNLSTALIKELCSTNVYKKAKCFEVKSSQILSTQVDPNMNCITGSYKAVKIYDQIIAWGNNANGRVPFSTTNLKVSCQCAFFIKATLGKSNCCKHIIGHLRRIKYLSTISH